MLKEKAEKRRENSLFPTCFLKHKKYSSFYNLNREEKNLTRLEEEDSDLTEVEVDEVLGFVGDVRAEVTADDAVPGGVVLLVELLLDVGGDVLFDVELFHGLGGDFGGVGLHVFGHVSVLDDGLTISGHFDFC